MHKACLHDGRVVAVKVQYLGLESEVAADMTTLAALSTLAGWLFPDSFREFWHCAGGAAKDCMPAAFLGCNCDDTGQRLGRSCPVHASRFALPAEKSALHLRAPAGWCLLATCRLMLVASSRALILVKAIEEALRDTVCCACQQQVALSGKAFLDLILLKNSA